MYPERTGFGYNQFSVKMKPLKKPIIFSIFITFLILLSACSQQFKLRNEEFTEEQSDAAAAPLKAEPMIEPNVSDVDKPSSIGFKLPVDLAEIKLENVDQIEWLGSIYPNTPPYFDISPDGRFFARGEPGRLTIFDVETGAQVSQFEIEFPNCAYGFEQYFRFNHDGSFISVITRTSIQVMQTGGGLIYENPHTRAFSLRYPSCGFDLPQVALSTDGKLLSFSGIDYSRSEPTRYFQVVDILENEILFEWNGNINTLHGELSGFFGLGFSGDGQYIQTFDPKRFIIRGEDLHKAFRFWVTKTWEEVTNTDVIRASFDTGELLFPLSDSGIVTIFDKLTGKKMAEIPAQGCMWDTPCEAAFSIDGTKALLLPRGKPQVQLGNHLFFQEIEIWDLENEKVLHRIPGYYRSLDGLQVTESGELINMQSMDKYMVADPTWWVTADLFQGVYTTQEKEIAFVPNRVGSVFSECQFCSTCILQAETGAINCRSGIEGSRGWYSIRMIDSEYWLVKHNPDGEGPIGKLSLHPNGDPESQRMRLAGYSEDHQTAFYCLDVDFRPQKCVIDDIGSGRLEEFDNLSFLRITPDNRSAVFLDSTAKSLFLYDLESGRLTRKSHYQAKAAMVNPVFSEDGLLLYYLVENLNRPGIFSVEIMDVESQKILKRIPLEGKIESPIAFALNRTEEIWIIATKYGSIQFFSPENGKALKEWDTEQDKIVGLTFDDRDKLLISLDSTGLMKFWGVDE
jgi:WD40 repeat protein